ncbi:MAG TPA: CocE/NonD family hydrolase [Solirubrobacterales bacterium]|nr:CocE/NonD family hydrolase [Solirubrobacterales bacterium]
MRKLTLLSAFVIALIAAPPALAAPLAPDAIDGDLTCGEVTADGNVSGATGQTWCGSIRASDDITSTVSPALPTQPTGSDPRVRSTTKTFDGVPLDVNVAFPDTGSAPYPVVGMFHGYGGSKSSFKSMQHWLDQGYAAYSLSQRGFGESCGSQESRDADPAGCAKGYVHLMDVRYEVRDTQLLLGKLVDEGLIQPDGIAATGGSYGGGMSLELAALKDRVMLEDNTLVPWESPEGTPMSLAVATPNIPWSELTYALAPNGNNLDYIEDAGYFGRTGVMKESYVQGLYAQGFKAPTGSDPRADISGWKARLDAGEPYDDDPAVRSMIDEINSFHSAYGVDHSVSPAPLLISSGFTDDLFPVNEATRFYNRTRAEHPDSPLALFFGSFGHARGQNTPGVVGALNDAQDEWVAHYLKGTGTAPASNVTAYTQACPDGTDGAGPYTAPDWASIAPGEIRVVDDGGAQTVDPAGGDTAVGAAFNPLSGTACTSTPGGEEPGTANYELPAAPAGGYTVMGAATVVARITLPGDTSQIAARLVDVSPDGTTKTLVERGLWRPENKGLQVFQLFANGWEVEEGHVLRLELLPRDAAQTTPGGFLSNYGRPSDDQQAATIEEVDIRVPVLEAPGSLGGLVADPAPKVLPKRPGVELAPGYEAIGAVAIRGDLELTGKPKVKGKRLRAKMTCDDDASYSCRKARLKLKGAPKGKRARGKNAVLVRAKDIRVDAGDTKKLKLKLTKRGRKLFRGRRDVGKLRAEVFIRGESAGFTTVR